MNSREKPGRSHFGYGIAAATLLYVIFAIRPVQQSLWLEPIAPILLPDGNYTSQQKPNSRKDDIRAFANSRTFGYYTDSGEVTYIASIHQAAAIDEGHILEMDDETGTILLSDAANMSSKKIPIAGYPYMTGDRLFILRPDQQAATEIDNEGRLLWSQEFGTLITNSSISGNVSAWGLLDGSIKLVGESGTIVSELRPEDYSVASGYPCIYSVAISHGGASIAAVYGLEDQYFLVFAKNGGTYELAYSKKLAQPIKSSSAAAFSGDGSCAIVRTAEGLVFYDVRKKEGKIIRNRYFGGNAASLKILPIGADTFAILLAKGRERFAGMLKRGAVEAFFPVAQDTAGMFFHDNILALSNSKSIVRYRVKEK